MKTTYSTPWGDSKVEISADWADATSPIDGLGEVQVADFSHDPEDAMRLALERMARADGLDVEDPEVAKLIDDSLEIMKEDGTEEDDLDDDFEDEDVEDAVEDDDDFIDDFDDDEEEELDGEDEYDEDEDFING